MSRLLRILDRLPDSPFVNFVAGMLFFIGVSILMVPLFYAVMFTFAVHPLTLIGWGWLAVVAGKRLTR